MIFLVLAIVTGTALLFWALMRRRQSGAKQENLASEATDNQYTVQQLVELQRQRIFNDLHDDIGGKLTSLVHATDGTPAAQLAREVLHDLRAVMANASISASTLLEVLAQIREEAEARCETSGAELTWEQDVEIPDLPISVPHALDLFRIVREGITNALRHAEPSVVRLRSRLGGHTLVLDITDDGATVDAARISAGRGTKNMQARAANLGGNISWGAGTGGGTKVLFKLPLIALENDHEFAPLTEWWRDHD